MGGRGASLPHFAEDRACSGLSGRISRRARVCQGEAQLNRPGFAKRGPPVCFHVAAVAGGGGSLVIRGNGGGGGGGGGGVALGRGQKKKAGRPHPTRRLTLVKNDAAPPEAKQ